MTEAETKAKIVGLEKEIETLKSRRIRLPAVSPGIYKASDNISFANFANNLDNYMRVMKVPTDQRSNVLLTFLSSKDYNNIVRIYVAKKLGSEKYEDVVQKISYVLNGNLSSSTALSRMLALKQRTTPIRDFISHLEALSMIAFPEANMKEARERCLISSIQAGCRSKVLAYEIHNFCKSKMPAPDFSEVCLKIMELDTILAGDENEGFNEKNETFASILNVKNDKRLCYQCASENHIAAQCPNGNVNFLSSQNKTNYNERGIRPYDAQNQYQNSAIPHENQIYSSAPYNAQLNNTHHTNYKQFECDRPLFNNRNNFDQEQRNLPDMSRNYDLGNLHTSYYDSQHERTVGYIPKMNTQTYPVNVISQAQDNLDKKNETDLENIQREFKFSWD